MAVNRSMYSGLIMRLMNPNFREPREIAKVNQTAINVITNLEQEVTELLFKRHSKRTKAEEARFRQLLGMK